MTALRAAFVELLGIAMLVGGTWYFVDRWFSEPASPAPELPACNEVELNPKGCR